MNSPIPRRDFLQTAGLASMGGVALALSGPTTGSESPAAFAGTPRMFVGCCAYSFDRPLTSGRMKMEDFILKAVELGTQGVDMTLYWIKSTDPDHLTSLRHLAAKNGVLFSGAACDGDMLQADKDKRLEVCEVIKKWVDVTDMLGASHLRVFAGELPQGATVAQGIAWTVETMKRACDYAAYKGITLGVETHSGITQKADAALEIMHRVNSPNAGINLDITHFIGDTDEDLYQQIQACVPYATHAHIQEVFDNHHSIDLDRVWQMFAKAGYRGYMSAEYQSPEDPEIGVPKLLAKIKALCRKYSTA